MYIAPTNETDLSFAKAEERVYIHTAVDTIGERVSASGSESHRAFVEVFPVSKNSIGMDVNGMVMERNGPSRRKTLWAESSLYRLGIWINNSQRLTWTSGKPQRFVPQRTGLG